MEINEDILIRYIDGMLTGGGSCGGEKLAGRLSRKRETVGAGLFYDSSGKSPKSHADREPGRGVVSF